MEGFKRLEGLERFRGFRAGKRQTWTPIRSQWCVAVGCLLTARVAIRSQKPLMCGAGSLLAEDEACEVNVVRQTWTPIRSQGCVAVGCLLAARVAIRRH